MSIPDLDGYSFGRIVPLSDEPEHAEGCSAQMVEKDGVEVVGVCHCVDACPSLAQAIQRGRELAEEYGW